MAMYILRNIDDGLWQRFKARAQGEGVPMRALILKLCGMYADGKINLVPKKAPTAVNEKPPPAD